MSLLYDNTTPVYATQLPSVVLSQIYDTLIMLLGCRLHVTDFQDVLQMVSGVHELISCILTKVDLLSGIHLGSLLAGVALVLITHADEAYHTFA